MVCNTIFNIGQSLNNYFNQKSWSLLFSVFQKVSYLIVETEFHKSFKTPNIFYAEIIEKRVKDNFSKFYTTSNQTITENINDKDYKIKEEITKEIFCENCKYETKSALILNSLVKYKLNFSISELEFQKNIDFLEEINMYKTSMESMFTITSTFQVF